MRTRAIARQSLADITPAAKSGATDTFPNTMPPSERELKDTPQSWDSLCVSTDCPIKHSHNFGLRPQIVSVPLLVWQDSDAVITDDAGYPDTQPPPLIKAMIDTLRIDPLIERRYPRFTDVLRDFYRAHGGRSDKYHGPVGMFGLGVDLTGGRGLGFYPFHKLPDEEGMGAWFAFELEEHEWNEDTVEIDCC